MKELKGQSESPSSSGGGTVASDGEGPGTPQGSIFEGVAKHSLIYGLGMVIGRAVSFLMLPIYTRYLSPADYGVMGLIEMTLDFVAILAGAQLAAGIFRFYHKADTRKAREQVVSTSFLLVAAMYGVVGTGCFVFAPQLSTLIFGADHNALLFQVASVNVALSALHIVPMSLARVEDRSTLYVGTNLAKLVLMVGFNVLFLVGMGMGVLGVFVSSLLSNALVSVVLTMWLFRRVRPGFDLAAARSLVRFGLPLMGMQLATFLATFSDRFFLQAAADEAAVGIYNLAYQFGFLLVMVGFVPVDQIWGPRRFRAIKEPDRDALLARAFVLINLLLLTVGVGIAVLVGDVLRIMTPPSFHSAAIFVPAILVAYVFQCWASVLDLGILVTERTEFLTMANVVAALVAVGGYWLLVPEFLAWGAVVATVLSFFVRFAMTYFLAQRLWPIRYQWMPILMLAAWASFIVAVSLARPATGIFASLGMSGGVLLVYFGGMWLLPILSKEDRQTARAVLRRIRR